MKKVYRSNIACPSLAAAFPYAKPINPGNTMKHVSLCDPELFPGCGYATHDEAAIISACVLPGSNALEIGSHTGWTTAHIALRAHQLTALDPEYGSASFNLTKDHELFLHRTKNNLARMKKIHHDSTCTIALYGEKSQDFIARYAAEKFDFVFIDGEHEPPFPENDAKLVLPHLADNAVVVFHDFMGWPVQMGVKYLVSQGFRFRFYKTPQFLAVCWRGMFVPPDHTPDPLFDWDNHMNRTLNIRIQGGVLVGPKGIIGKPE